MWNEWRAREALLDTVGDVRMDGTMASISGTDSPNILITKSLQQYIEQTQDISVLMEERTYFDDASHRQIQRVREGQESKESSVYKGTILEHLLVLHLVAFYEMLERVKLARCEVGGGKGREIGDFNEGIGSFDAKKPTELADCMMCVADWMQALLEKQGVRHLEIAVELDVLLAHREDLLWEEDYGVQVLEQYIKSVDAERVSVKTHLPAKLIIDSLMSKAKWLSGKEDEDE